MSEEEIIEIIEELMCLYKEQMNCNKYYNEIIERSTKKFNGLQGLLDLYNKEKEKNKKAIQTIKDEIMHCEQEAKGSLNNEKCHIALKFYKHLLELLAD